MGRSRNYGPFLASLNIKEDAVPDAKKARILTTHHVKGSQC